MEAVNSLNPVLLNGMILITVLMLEKVLVIPEKSHPLTMVRLMASKLGQRVLKKQQRSEYQQKVSGGMSAFVILFPIILVMITFIWFAEYDWFFNGLFLFLALQFVPIQRRANSINALLKQQKKALARNHLSRVVLRHVENLSSMGIAKANMETLILRFHYQYLSTLFWFMIFGGMGALIYRLCYEMAQEWNIKQDNYKNFGRPLSVLCHYLQWIPVRLTLILFVGTLGLTGSLKAMKQLKGSVSTHSLILAIYAGALGRQLGGPAFYNNRKYRLPKVGTEVDPTLEDGKRLKTLLIQFQIVLMSFLSLCYAGVIVGFA